MLNDILKLLQWLDSNDRIPPLWLRHITPGAKKGAGNG